MHPKDLKIFLVTENGSGYNKNNTKFESAMLDIHDGMHSKYFISVFVVADCSDKSKFCFNIKIMKRVNFKTV